MQCPVTADWHNKFVTKFFPGLAFQSESEKIKFFFLGILPGDQTSTQLVSTTVQCWMFCIWEEKLRKRAPSFHTLTTLFLEYLKPMLITSNKLYLACFKNDFAIYRIFAPRPAINQQQDAPVGAG
jgi:hypothetical protein